MAGAVMAIHDNKVRKSSLTSTTKAAWAQYVRRRWPSNTLCHVQEEWDLSEGEARGVVYEQASQRTIDKIENHKNGGVMLALDLLLIRFRTTLEDVATSMEEQNAHDRLCREARVEREGRALRRLQDSCSLDSESGS